MVLGEDGMKGERRGPRAWFAELDRLLGGELTGVPTLRERGLGISPWRLSACIIILAMSYGLCMGTFAVFGVKGPDAAPGRGEHGQGPAAVLPHAAGDAAVAVCLQCPGGLAAVARRRW